MSVHQETLDFVAAHIDDDVRRLAFLGDKHPGVDLPWALDQIRGRQMARRKLPSWAAKEGIVYPPHLSMEQCSSEATARYKARVAMEWMEKTRGGRSFAPEEVGMADLTGGFGVDFSYLARALQAMGGRAVYVEQQAALCETARRNFRLLGLQNVEIVHGECSEIIDSIGNCGLIYLDPARRDAQGAKTYAIEDCTPDVSLLRDRLLAQAPVVIVKLSPMLDWHRACRTLNAGRSVVSEVHVVSVDNECKELLLVLYSTKQGEGLRVCCVDDGRAFDYTLDGAATGTAEAQRSLPVPDDWLQRRLSTAAGAPPEYLYEPHASLMKAGCFGLLCRRYGVRALGDNSHLFVSNDEIDDFPGRRFRIDRISTMNRKQLRQALAGISRANVAVRNFPLSVAELRKKLKLRDGGEAYLFATTVGNRGHVILVCSKQ